MEEVQCSQANLLIAVLHICVFDSIYAQRIKQLNQRLLGYGPSEPQVKIDNILLKWWVFSHKTMNSFFLSVLLRATLS